MYYIIKTNDSEIIGLNDVESYNIDLYEKEEYIFKRNGTIRFVIPTLDIEYILGTEDEEEWRTLLVKLEQGDDVVYSF